MTKSLGQVAEHAYDSCPDSDEDVCWQAAAEAVAEELAKPWPVNATYEAEYKVVEAARAWRRNRQGQIVWWQRPLLDALEALEEVE